MCTPDNVLYSFNSFNSKYRGGGFMREIGCFNLATKFITPNPGAFVKLPTDEPTPEPLPLALDPFPRPT